MVARFKDVTCMYALVYCVSMMHEKPLAQASMLFSIPSWHTFLNSSFTNSLLQHKLMTQFRRQRNQLLCHGNPNLCTNIHSDKRKEHLSCLPLTGKERKCLSFSSGLIFFFTMVYLELPHSPVIQYVKLSKDVLISKAKFDGKFSHFNTF